MMPDKDKSRRDKLREGHAAAHRAIVERGIEQHRQDIESIPAEQWKKAQENDAETRLV